MTDIAHEDSISVADPSDQSPTALNTPWLDFIKAAIFSLIFKKVQVESLRMLPLPLIAMLAAYLLITIGLNRLTISGEATFYSNAIMWGWWSSLISIWLCWIVSTEARRNGKKIQIAALFAITETQSFLLSTLSSIIYVLGIKPFGLDGSTTHWAYYIIISAWSVLAYWFLLARSSQAKRWLSCGLGLAAVGIFIISYYYRAPEYWYAKNTDTADTESYLTLNQSNIEKQLQIAADQRNSVKNERKGIIDLYGISFAPYADNVFLNESNMVQAVMKSRFDVEGHWQELINNKNTISSEPWATTENLERAINQAANKMNRDEDILFLYLTSHGGKDATLSASNWPPEVESLTPYTLNLWLEKAKIKYRVIVISACYSGSWIKPLENVNTLILTAADAAHTSYGCGNKSDLTYFGRALIDEQLKTTHSFEQAFKNAVPIIKQREIDNKKDDGFSNPQISLGAGIKSVLSKLEKQLD